MLTIRLFGSLASLLCLLGLQMSTANAAHAQPARFLLTFDDGPSTKTHNNPTESILRTLDSNAVQNGIKAIFFTQTRLGPDRKGQLTLQLLTRNHLAGHLLAIHSGSRIGILDHRLLKGGELHEFLVNSQNALRGITGHTPRLIRPPYWAFNERTWAAYREVSLSMLLTDISVGDGKSWGFRANPRRRSVLLKQMQVVKQRIDDGGIPLVEGLHPIIVTFHDTNTWTASHMEEYLKLLIESASSAGVTLDQRTFYAQRETLERVAVRRSELEPNPEEMVPSRWRWLHGE
ncbi:MAG: polysaccharide deacetylase family protein [Xanthomonadales bacterium]|nr:polysaccharide deacetylase family protein [Xanthomonadales bacterium]